MTATIHITGKVRKFGNSLAIIIPAAVAKKSHITAGTDVDVDLLPRRRGPEAIVGLLKGVIPYAPFSRAEFYNEDDD